MLLATQFRLGCVCIDWQRPKSNICACTHILPLSLLWDFTVCADWLPADVPALILKVHVSLLLLLKNLVKATSPPSSFILEDICGSYLDISTPGMQWCQPQVAVSSTDGWTPPTSVLPCLHFAMRFWKLLRQPLELSGWLGRKHVDPYETIHSLTCFDLHKLGRRLLKMALAIYLLVTPSLIESIQPIPIRSVY